MEFPSSFTRFSVKSRDYEAFAYCTGTKEKRQLVLECKCSC